MATVVPWLHDHGRPGATASIADKAVARSKHRVRELTRRHRGVSLERMIADLNPLLRGWAGYFGFTHWRELGSLDGWIRRRLRCDVWVQWKTRGRRYQELRRLRVPERAAKAAILSPKGPWRLSFASALHRAFTKARFKALGLLPMEKLVATYSAEPPWYGPVCPVVWEGWHREMLPYPDWPVLPKFDLLALGEVVGCPAVVRGPDFCGIVFN